MRMVDLIEKKKQGEILTAEEIDYVVHNYTRGEIPDYQMSAFLMAIYFRGMNKQEISDMTMSFVRTGEIVDLTAIEGIKVDKHSTGGVGDKISLIVIPLVAAFDIPVAKMSGRGLGHTGGTIDKLESIEGFRTDLNINDFITNVNKYKMAITGQTSNLAPADKKIYALRDVTATINSIPLIASSVMSKKIASGADCIILDVKVGSGAFMKTVSEARDLSYTMVEIGKSLNKKTIAVITNMEQPLGHEVGNANEVMEAINVLKGLGSKDETEVALTIASYMCILGGAFDDFNTAYNSLQELIISGKAIEKLKELIIIQGGNSEIVENTNLLPQAKYHYEVKVDRNGFISKINAEQIGIAAMLLGAGRATKDDKIDHAAGITMIKKIRDEVKTGETICILHTNKIKYDDAKNMVISAFELSNEKPEEMVYIYDIIQ